jgi:hypothetical protein
MFTGCTSLPLLSTAGFTAETTSGMNFLELVVCLHMNRSVYLYADEMLEHFLFLTEEVVVSRTVALLTQHTFSGPVES